MPNTWMDTPHTPTMAMDVLTRRLPSNKLINAFKIILKLSGVAGFPFRKDGILIKYGVNVQILQSSGKVQH